MAFTSGPRDAAVSGRVLMISPDTQAKLLAKEQLETVMTNYEAVQNQVARQVGQARWATYFYGTFGPQSF